MDMTLDPMQVLRQQGHQSWIKGWYEGLANCKMCDHDYIDAQRLKNMEDELLCPNCLKPECKTYYYCEDHGQMVCKECKHNV